jgi:hypothetical protein
MIEAYKFLERLKNRIGNNCAVFASPRHGGLLIQVDWIDMDEFNHIRWQYVISFSESLSVPAEFLENYIVTRAVDEYNLKTVGKLYKAEKWHTY